MKFNILRYISDLSCQMSNENNVLPNDWLNLMGKIQVNFHNSHFHQKLVNTKSDMKPGLSGMQSNNTSMDSSTKDDDAQITALNSSLPKVVYIGEIIWQVR